MEKQYQVALTLVDGVGSVMFRQLVARFGSAEQVFKAGSEQLLKTPGVGKQLLKALKASGLMKSADEILNQADKQGARLCFYSDDDYPARFKDLHDSPVVLYYKGNADLNIAHTVGIVGTRQATDYGKRITEEIVAGLAPHQAMIVSGLAYGIDIAAHKAALDNNMPTVGVMASGLDVIYPAAHRKVAEQMQHSGGILSENPFGMQPIRNLFLARNRIIAGMSDVVVVVESAAKGGALVTAMFANDYHREVFAVPGSLNNKYSEGCHQLIRDNKAAIYTSVNDIVQAVHWGVTSKKQEPKAVEYDFARFSTDEVQVITCLQTNGDMHIDNLSWQTHLPVNQLASVLLNLEFQGVIKALTGKKFGLK